MYESLETLTLDATDLRLLAHLQADATLSNQALATLAHTSPATAQRRVKRLYDSGLIERAVAIVSPHKLAAIRGAGLTVLIEISLDKQGAEYLDAFEKQCVAEACVQQCYRVSPGPDFVLIVHVQDMPAYHAFTQRLLTQEVNVRTVKAYFSVKRAKFEPRISLS
jgi:Lrp/AsnC family transcriptional regulator, leucine-responsive regulatory protein